MLTASDQDKARLHYSLIPLELTTIARLVSLFASGGVMTGGGDPPSESGTENEPE